VPTSHLIRGTLPETADSVEKICKDMRVVHSRIAMDDKSALLDQLRIERGSSLPAPGRRWVWVVVSMIVLGIAGLLLWKWLRPTGVPVHVAVAQAVATGGGAAAASILDASGYVVARRQATVASKITAKMVELDIEEGDHVQAGQMIARLDDSNIRAALNQSNAQLDYAKASLAETEVNMANAQRDYDRQKTLMQGHFVSQSALDNAQTTLDALRAQLATQRSNVDVVASGVKLAERNLEDTIVRAPFAGVVTVKAAQPGEMVSPISAGGGFTRTGIGTIVDMDSLELQVDVNENFINRVRPGQVVAAKLNAYPDWPIAAHVIAMIPTADRSKGTVMVRIAIDQKDPRVLPEMGVRVSFLADAPRDPGGATQPVTGSSLPNEAVAAAGATGAVFVLRDGVVERRAVRLGPSSNGRTTIVAGLEPGTRVAVGDLGKLRDGEKIVVIE
jgi:RND family efflux transporter MFP subunit